MTLPSRLAAVLGSLTIIAAGAACAPADDAADAAATAAQSVGQPADGTVPSYDSGAVAANIVTASLRVREGEAVLITGSPRDQQLLEDLAVQVRRQGAYPLVRMATDRMRRRLVVDVPEQYDTQDPFGVTMAEVFDVMIEVENGEDPALLADVPPERLALRAQRDTDVETALRENGVRLLHVGNGMYPTAAQAGEAGMSESELATMFWKAVNTDPALIDAEGRRIRAMLEGGNEVRVTAPNGTDLTLRIANPTILISDGAISPEEEAMGGPSNTAWLPGGELYFAPAPGSATGTVVIDPFEYDGVPVEGLKLTLENGRMTSMDAAAGLETVRRDFDAAADGKDRFGAFDIGLNPNVTVAPGSRFRSWVAAGMVTVGIGNDSWAGGANMVPYGLYGHIAGATVTVDGRPVVENGRLVR